MMNAAVVDNGSVDKIDSAASKLDVKDIDYNKVDKNIDRKDILHDTRRT